jgi:peptide/nickel transport system substrate-binding protein
MLAMLKETGLNVSLTMYEVKDWEGFYSKPFAEDRGATHPGAARQREG